MRGTDTIVIPRKPTLSVDIIIEYEDGIILIKRKYPPIALALPGGHVDYGETTLNAAIREAKEETGLDVEIFELLGVYSNPKRDPRKHMVSIAYIGKGKGTPKAGDDAGEVIIYKPNAAVELAFDHNIIIRDYLDWKICRIPAPLGR